MVRIVRKHVVKADIIKRSIVGTYRLVLLALLLNLFLFTEVSMASARSDSVVVVLGNGDWPPFQLVDRETGRVTGIWRDICQLLFKDRMGLDVRFELLPWKRAQHAVEFGSADVLFAVPTDVRRAYAGVTTVPVYSMYLSLFTAANHPSLEEIRKIRTVDDIERAGLVQVSNSGNGWTKENTADRGIKTFWMNDDFKVARFLAEGRADFAIDETVSFQKIVKRVGLEGRVVRTDAQFGPVDMYILVGKRSPLSERLQEINGHLKRMRNDGTLGLIWESYEDPFLLD